jgi:coenzyme F420-reducing hydrogenase delta subunit
MFFAIKLQSCHFDEGEITLETRAQYLLSGCDFSFVEMTRLSINETNILISKININL